MKGLLGSGEVNIILDHYKLILREKYNGRIHLFSFVLDRM